MRRGGSERPLFAKASGTADTRIATFIKSKSPLSCPRDSDTHTFTDGLRRPSRGAQPQRSFTAKIGAVVALVDAQCRGQPARSARQVANARGFAIFALHHADAFQRFESPEKHACANAGRFARDVDEPGRAIGEMHVSKAALQEKRVIGDRLAAERVSGGISRRIGFCLDNAPADSALWQIVYQRLADQESREFQRGDGEFAPAQAPYARPPSHGISDCFFR